MKSFDYSENHRYFITICSDGKRKMFSDISVGEGCSPLGRRHEVTEGEASPPRNAPPVIHLSAIGKIIEEQLLALSTRYHQIEIENHVIMPNHLHMILRLENTGGASPSPTTHDIICALKSLVTRSCRQIGYRGNIWQRSYYEHIIRNEDDYKNTWIYIDNNPARWSEDEYYQ